MIEGVPVCEPDELICLEKKAFTSGVSAGDLMDRAAEEIAEVVLAVLETLEDEKKVTLLVGPGNNGADALSVGLILNQEGIEVSAIALSDQGSLLLEERMEHFKETGSLLHILKPSDLISFDQETLIIDGLFGTGFHGGVKGCALKLIETANDSGCTIISIDIPSGLDAKTGVVETEAIFADITIALSAPKKGFFIGEGWERVGEIIVKDIGLDLSSLCQNRLFVDAGDLIHLLPYLPRRQHKYEAGYLLGVGGSRGMSGSIALTTASAMRSGSGIVRLFHPEEMELSKISLEVITEVFSADRFKEEILRAKAVLLGPGLGRSASAKKIFWDVFQAVQTPLLIDADGLYFLSERKETSFNENVVLTPHVGEMERILGGELSDHLCQEFVDKKGCVLVLKGPFTLIFAPKKSSVIVTRGDRGMATAGSGDVLSGVIASFLSQGVEGRTAAILGVYLHGVAGEYAAQARGSFSLIASDIIEHLSDAFRDIETS